MKLRMKTLMMVGLCVGCVGVMWGAGVEEAAAKATENFAGALSMLAKEIAKVSETKVGLFLNVLGTAQAYHKAEAQDKDATKTKLLEAIAALKTNENAVEELQKYPEELAKNLDEMKDITSEDFSEFRLLNAALADISEIDKNLLSETQIEPLKKAIKDQFIKLVTKINEDIKMMIDYFNNKKNKGTFDDAKKDLSYRLALLANNEKIKDLIKAYVIGATNMTKKVEQKFLDGATAVLKALEEILKMNADLVSQTNLDGLKKAIDDGTKKLPKT